MSDRNVRDIHHLYTRDDVHLEVDGEVSVQLLDCSHGVIAINVPKLSHFVVWIELVWNRTTPKSVSNLELRVAKERVIILFRMFLGLEGGDDHVTIVTGADDLFQQLHTGLPNRTDAVFQCWQHLRRGQ